MMDWKLQCLHNKLMGRALCILICSMEQFTNVYTVRTIRVLNSDERTLVQWVFLASQKKNLHAMAEALPAMHQWSSSFEDEKKANFRLETHQPLDCAGTGRQKSITPIAAQIPSEDGDKHGEWRTSGGEHTPRESQRAAEASSRSLTQRSAPSRHSEGRKLVFFFMRERGVDRFVFFFDDEEMCPWVTTGSGNEEKAGVQSNAGDETLHVKSHNTCHSAL